MNKSIFTFLTILFVVSVEAQLHISENRIKPQEVPPKIRGFVEERYSEHAPKYYKLIWQDSTINYEVSLKKGRETVYAIFHENQELLSIDNVIEYQAIPISIKEKIEKDLRHRFPKFKVGTCKIQFQRDKTFYKIELKVDHKKIFIFYGLDGKFIEQKPFPEKPLGPIFH